MELMVLPEFITVVFASQIFGMALGGPVAARSIYLPLLLNVVLLEPTMSSVN